MFRVCFVLYFGAIIASMRFSVIFCVYIYIYVYIYVYTYSFIDWLRNKEEVAMWDYLVVVRNAFRKEPFAKQGHGALYAVQQQLDAMAAAWRFVCGRICEKALVKALRAINKYTYRSR